MALVLKDRVKETTTTTGTGTYTLAGAVTGFETFASVGNSNTTYYACSDGTNFEVGVGTYTSSGTTLARTTILQSSNSDNAVDWGSGTKTIFCTLPAEKMSFLDASGVLNITTSAAIDNITIDGNTISTTDTNGSLLLTPNGNGDIIAETDTFTIRHTDDGQLGPNLVLDHTTASPSTTDTHGIISALTTISGGTEFTPAQILFQTPDLGVAPTGKLAIKVKEDGNASPTNYAQFDGDQERISFSKELNISGRCTATTFEPFSDTSAGDTAAVGYTAAEGLILTGQGSTNDVTIKNDADADVLKVPTGTVNVTMAGTLDVVGDITGSTLDVVGDITGSTLNADGDTAAGDNAAIGYTAAEGLILTGQGSTSDITVKNDADATVFTVPTGTDDILFPDDAKAMFGAGSDLQIYHDGTDSHIDVAGTLNIDGSGETLATFVDDGAVSLYHNNEVKLATASTGVAVTGKLEITSASDGDATAGIVFEGATHDDHETTLFATDPTADRSILLPDAAGNISLDEQLRGDATNGSGYMSHELVERGVINTGTGFMPNQKPSSGSAIYLTAGAPSGFYTTYFTLSANHCYFLPFSLNANAGGGGVTAIDHLVFTTGFSGTVNATTVGMGIYSVNKYGYPSQRVSHGSMTNSTSNSVASEITPDVTNIPSGRYYLAIANLGASSTRVQGNYSNASGGSFFTDCFSGNVNSPRGRSLYITNLTATTMSASFASQTTWYINQYSPLMHILLGTSYSGE